MKRGARTSMQRKDADPRSEMIGPSLDGTGRKPEDKGEGVSSCTAERDSTDLMNHQLMEAVVESESMQTAWRRVRGNKGAAGVDRMTLAELGPYLRNNWAEIKVALLNGSYQPQGVRRVDIPKPGGKGSRMLGIPTVLDRLIQQAIHQVLKPIFEPGSSASSYGFRPGRSTHHALKAAQGHVSDGYRWVVDMDLEKFFDRVNHDILMSRLARRIKDKRILKLIRNYLQAGMMNEGIASQRSQGMPQGGPLCPLLSNILLDELDKELERRGHRFCRYADDVNVHVQSRRAGERVLSSVTRFLEKTLKLKVNQEKSAVDRPWKRRFLGYSITWHRKPKLKVAPQSVAKLKEELKRWFRAGRGRKLGRFLEPLKPFLRGWFNYFRLSEVKITFEKLDEWIRRRLRCILWRQWKRPRTRRKKLERLGLSKERAWKSSVNGRGPWWNSGASHMNQALPKRYFAKQGLISLLDSAVGSGNIS